MSWNLQQQGMLAAMGYTLYRPAGRAPEPVAPAVNAPAVAAQDKLLLALRRAAGGRDLDGLPLPPLDRLRTDAAAKRALWPVLRALRRR